jgi:hypothetical protein
MSRDVFAPAIKPFVTTIRLDALLTVYAAHQINAPLAITIDPAGAIPGATAALRLVSDGVNIPTFSGVKRANASADFYNGATIVNIVQIFYDGVDFWMSMWQEDGVVPPDIAAPVLQTAVIYAATPDRINLIYSENLQSNPPANSAYSIAGKSITGITIAGNTVTIIVNSPFAAGSVSINYTPGSNPIRDAAGNLAAALTNQSVINLAAEGSPIAFSTRSPNITVNGLNTVYTSTSAVNWGEFMLADKFLPANTDGWISIQGATNGAGVSAVLGFNTSNINQSYSGNYEFFAWISAGTFYYGTNGGGVTNTFVAGTALYRLRRVSGSISLQSSSNSGLTWTTIYTWPGTQNAALYVNVAFAALGVVSNPIGSGLI